VVPERWTVRACIHNAHDMHVTSTRSARLACSARSGACGWHRGCKVCVMRVKARARARDCMRVDAEQCTRMSACVVSSRMCSWGLAGSKLGVHRSTVIGGNIRTWFLDWQAVAAVSRRSEAEEIPWLFEI
jgi:hypothetical protein